MVDTLKTRGDHESIKKAMLGRKEVTDARKKIIDMILQAVRLG